MCLQWVEEKGEEAESDLYTGRSHRDRSQGLVPTFLAIEKDSFS